MTEDLLSTIDSVDWKKYKTAMRRWRNVPASLRYLAGFDPEPTKFGKWLRMMTRSGIWSNQQAICNLANELEHQGYVSPAAFPSIPILCSLLPSLNAENKNSVTELLMGVAFPFCDGLELYHESSWWDPNYYRLLESYSECFLPLLEDESTQLMGCFALGWFPRLRESSLPILRSLSRSGDQELKVAAIFTRGLLGDKIEILDGGSELRVRRVSAIAKGYSSGACEECLEIFAEMSTYEPLDYPDRGLDWSGPDERHLFFTTIEFLRRTDPAVREKFMDKAVVGRMKQSVAEPFSPESCSDLKPWLTLSGSGAWAH